MIVVDTHVLVWWASDATRLSAPAKRAIDRSLKDGPFLVSAISIFEIATAIRRGRLALTMPADQWLADLAILPEIAVEPVTADIAASAGR
ncbi:MAG: type II toxin-antitoxin system VapC family toxin, partial [Burkholderiales bacterium]|nr:type II toxin-antitoxin system VapC family toxin [Burkholderiales bacterium]